MLDAGTVLNEAELKSAMDRQNTAVSAGDVVLLHTGWMAMTEQDPENSLRTIPGLGVQGGRIPGGPGGRCNRVRYLGARSVAAGKSAGQVSGARRTPGKTRRVHSGKYQD